MSAPERSPGDGDFPFSETLYEELKLLATRHMHGERANHTLQPTALVHEAWVRLRKRLGESLDEGRFRALAAETLRRVLIDHARARGADKRGGGRRQEELPADVTDADAAPRISLLDLERALERLAQHDERHARVVELRFLAGFTVGETARALAVSKDTVKRDWRVARAWLNRELSGGGET